MKKKNKTTIKWGNGEKLTITKLKNGNVKLDIHCLGTTELPTELFFNGILQLN